MKASPHSRLRKYRNLLCLAVKPFYRRFVLAVQRSSGTRIGAAFEQNNQLGDHSNRRRAVSRPLLPRGTSANQSTGPIRGTATTGPSEPQRPATCFCFAKLRI